MVLEEGYSSGLDTFLSGKGDLNALKDVTKAILYYPPYIIPGVWLYRYYKKPKEERKRLGLIGSWAYTAGFVLKFIIPVYITKGIATGNWHPFKFDHKPKTEQIDQCYDSNNSNKDIKNKKSKKSGRLEKTVDYEKIFRK